MRLSCEVHLSYRKVGGPGRRLGQAVITISPNLRVKTSPGVFNLVITTRQNEAGLTYKNVKTNAIKVFTSCVREGKLTISFKDPEHDILIKKANATQLDHFVKILHAIVKGLELPKKFTSQPPTKIQPRVTKLSITQRGEYPISGFPKELEILRIQGIKLSRLQNKMFELSNLVELAVENNLLEEVPKALGSTRLASLSLQGNRIKRVYDVFSGSLGSTLKALNLSHNEIVQMPYSLCRTKLIHLDLSHNQLETLPPNFHGGDQLSVLKLNNNRLRYLPASLRVPLGEVNLQDNGELFDQVQPLKPTPGPMNLLDFAGRAVHRAFPVRLVAIDDAIPRILYPYLLSFVPCGGCGRLTFPAPQRRSLKLVHTLELARSVVANADDRGLVRQADIRCSPVCAKLLS